MSWLLSRLRASPLSEMGSGSGSEVFVRCRAWWKGCDVSPQAAFPNYKPALVHRKHRFKAHTYGVQKQSLLRCIDNSKIGREAMAEGRPPKVIKVYTQ